MAAILPEGEPPKQKSDRREHAAVFLFVRMARDAAADRRLAAQREAARPESVFFNTLREGQENGL
jgi:hypothetical protein